MAPDQISREVIEKAKRKLETEVINSEYALYQQAEAAFSGVKPSKKQTNRQVYEASRKYVKDLKTYAAFTETVYINHDKSRRKNGRRLKISTKSLSQNSSTSFPNGSTGINRSLSAIQQSTRASSPFPADGGNPAKRAASAPVSKDRSRGKSPSPFPERTVSTRLKGAEGNLTKISEILEHFKSSGETGSIPHISEFYKPRPKPEPKSEEENNNDSDRNSASKVLGGESDVDSPGSQYVASNLDPEGTGAESELIGEKDNDNDDYGKKYEAMSGVEVVEAVDKAVGDSQQNEFGLDKPSQAESEPNDFSLSQGSPKSTPGEVPEIGAESLDYEASSSDEQNGDGDEDEVLKAAAADLDNDDEQNGNGDVDEILKVAAADLDNNDEQNGDGDEDEILKAAAADLDNNDEQNGDGDEDEILKVAATDLDNNDEQNGDGDEDEILKVAAADLENNDEQNGNGDVDEILKVAATDLENNDEQNGDGDEDEILKVAAADLDNNDEQNGNGDEDEVLKVAAADLDNDDNCDAGSTTNNLENTINDGNGSESIASKGFRESIDSHENSTSGGKSDAKEVRPTKRSRKSLESASVDAGFNGSIEEIGGNKSAMQDKATEDDIPRRKRSREASDIDNRRRRDSTSQRRKIDEAADSSRYSTKSRRDSVSRDRTKSSRRSSPDRCTNMEDQRRDRTKDRDRDREHQRSRESDRDRDRDRGRRGSRRDSNRESDRRHSTREVDRKDSYVKRDKDRDRDSYRRDRNELDVNESKKEYSKVTSVDRHVQQPKGSEFNERQKGSPSHNTLNSQERNSVKNRQYQSGSSPLHVVSGLSPTPRRKVLLPSPSPQYLLTNTSPRSLSASGSSQTLPRNSTLLEVPPLARTPSPLPLNRPKQRSQQVGSGQRDTKQIATKVFTSKAEEWMSVADDRLGEISSRYKVASDTAAAKKDALAAASNLAMHVAVEILKALKMETNPSPKNGWQANMKSLLLVIKDILEKWIVFDKMAKDLAAKERKEHLFDFLRHKVKAIIKMRLFTTTILAKNSFRNIKDKDVFKDHQRCSSIFGEAQTATKLWLHDRQVSQKKSVKVPSCVEILHLHSALDEVSTAIVEVVSIVENDSTSSTTSPKLKNSGRIRGGSTRTGK